MYRYVFLFPAGLPGVGLILLRVSVAISLWPVPSFLALYLGDLGSFVFFGALFVCLIAGALASVAATICFAILAVTAFMTHGHPIDSMVVAGLGCLSSAMMGPGAYSFDSMLYGHRIVKSNSCQRFPLE